LELNDLSPSTHLSGLNGHSTWEQTGALASLPVEAGTPSLGFGPLGATTEQPITLQKTHEKEADATSADESDEAVSALNREARATSKRIASDDEATTHNDDDEASDDDESEDSSDETTGEKKKPMSREEKERAEVERILARDPALDDLFEAEMIPHHKALYRFAYKLTGDEDEANDLVQDTYLKAYRFIGSYEEGSNAKAWLFRILKNSFINNYRKQSKEPNKVDYEEAENFLNTGISSYRETIDGRDKMFRSMVGDEVTRALNALPVDFRTVIILCDIEEFTYEEIAKIVDIPIGTVRSRLHRARKMLREMLTIYATEMGYDTDEK